MSRGDLIRTMQTEIMRLNQQIDLKIIKGASYRREAKRHKFLLTHLRDLTPRRFAFFF